MEEITVITKKSVYSSFFYVTQSLVNLLKDYRFRVFDISEVKGYIKNSILIYSTINSLSSNIEADIYWTDEPMLIPNRYFSNKPFKYFLAVSNYYREHLAKHFNIYAHDTVYRPYNPIADSIANCNYSKKYDIIAIAIDDYSERKNVDLIVEYLAKNRNVKAVLITNAIIPKLDNVILLKTGKVDEEDKFKLIKQSRFLLFPSSLESFGLPVLEAMAVGTVPIYPNTPPFIEFAEGIAIDNCIEKETYRYYCKTRIYEIDKYEFFNTVDYALSLSCEEYSDLSEMCRRKAVEINNDVKNKLIKYISKIVYE